MFGFKKCLCIVIISVLFFSINLYAEKYAVLIIGDEASYEEGTTRTLDNQGNENLIFNPYGEGLMVVAPGVDIWSTQLDNTYGINEGTSFAAPQVAGVAGLIASIYPDFTNIDIERVICLTAEKLSNFDFIEDKEYGTWDN